MLEIQKKYIYLNFCGISPFFDSALEKKQQLERLHNQKGVLFFSDFPDIVRKFRNNYSRLLKTNPENISFVKNTSEAISIIANGYPFESENDEILSFIHEYPANHYSWKLLERKNKAKLILIPNNKRVARNFSKIPDDYVVGFNLEDIQKFISSRTKIISLSHVQFTSGFACNLKKIGEFCKQNHIDFIVDAAQSLGCLPVYPDEWNISAIASSGWKWLLGPIGSGILYTSPQFRKKIDFVLAGPDMMKQGTNFLDHTWNPYEDARKFEYSTYSYADLYALSVCVEELILKYGIENIQKHIFELHDIFKSICSKSNKVQFIEWEEENRSGILSVIVDEPEKIANHLKQRNIITTVRGNYLRIAPHIITTKEEIIKSAETLLEVLH